jgi:SAM-dependent methyltransferase
MSTPRHIARYSPDNTVSEGDGRLRSPSFERNFAPIRDGLRPYLDGRKGTVLEIGSGTGQHIAHWAGEFPGLTWVPSDIHTTHHASIAAWCMALDNRNMSEPLFVDASADWPGQPPVQALGELITVLSCNVVHIAPWAVAEGIVHGAARALEPGGVLILYGPFREAGHHTGEGNARFDAKLRAENPDWGVRDIDEIAALAEAAGFSPARITRMPSNNLLVAFRRDQAITSHTSRPSLRG